MIKYRNPYPNELYHYGIKGQKYGVRRYQNKDGSLTPEGKERYYKSSAKEITWDDVDKSLEKQGKERYYKSSAKEITWDNVPKSTWDDVDKSLEKHGAKTYDTTDKYKTGNVVADTELAYYKEQQIAKMKAAMSIVEDIVLTGASVAKAASKIAKEKAKELVTNLLSSMKKNKPNMLGIFKK